MRCVVFVLSNNEGNLKKTLSFIRNQEINDISLAQNINICFYGTNSISDNVAKELESQSIGHLLFKSHNLKYVYKYLVNAILNSDYDYVWLLSDKIVGGDKKAILNLIETANDYSTPFVSNYVTSLDDEHVYSFVNNTNKNLEQPAANKVLLDNVPWGSILLNVSILKQSLLIDDGDIFHDQSIFLRRIASTTSKGIGLLDSIVILEEKAPISYYNIEPKVCTIIVTYNRSELLMECLASVLKQEYKNNDILIVDNNSTDDTYAIISPYIGDKVFYVNTGRNIGGAGGFYYGMKWAYERGYDYFWIMDDDVITNPSSLIELVKASSYVPRASFYASTVYSTDGTAMNTPEISSYSTNGYKFWYEWLKYGLVRLAHATFVSLLFKRNTITRCGLPCKDYFIWGDDTEYTMRVIGGYNPAYLVGKSSVIHKRVNKQSLDVFAETNEARIKMYYYLVRNTLINTYFYKGQIGCDKQMDKYLHDIKVLSEEESVFADKKIAVIKNALTDFNKGLYKKDKVLQRKSLYGQEEIRADIFGNEKLYLLLSNNCYTSVDNYYSSFSFLNDDISGAWCVLENDEFNSEEVNCNLLYELKNKKFLSLKGLDNFLFINFSYMFGQLYKFITKDERTLYMSLSNQELKKLLECHFFEINSFEKISITNLDMNLIISKLDFFVLGLSKKYKSNHIVVDRSYGKSLNSEEEKLVGLVENYFSSKFPGCHTIQSEEIESAYDLIDLVVDNN